MTNTPDILALTRTLIERPSVTPDDSNCQQLLTAYLDAAGFACETLLFNDVTNLWATHGSGSPVLVLAGHTDVVPPGDESRWQSPPFVAVEKDGYLYGRGAADMKSSLAAMVWAACTFVARHPEHQGTLAFLLTSDEEGPAIDGTQRVLAALGERGVQCDLCIVGEPSSSEHLGDVVRNGRRGSLNGQLQLHGVQGHVAYPDAAVNPIHAAARLFDGWATRHWDHGNAFFPPTSFQLSNVSAGTGATNVVPGQLDAAFNFRYCTEQTAAGLKAAIVADLEASGLAFDVEWHHSGEPFLTRPGKLTSAIEDSIEAVTGRRPELSTSGGTSDGRFFAPTGCDVIELGPVNATIHKVNECVRMADLEPLGRIYHGALERLLGVS